MDSIVTGRAVRTLVLLAVGATAATALAAGGEPTRPVSKVFKLTHLAVILPELQETRDDWQCDLWTPTVEDVAGAEKAVLQRIKERIKAGETIDGQKIQPNAHYLIQYYGLVREKRTWIVCSVVNLRTLRPSAGSEDELAGMLESLLTRVYWEYDAGNWFDEFYDPVTKKLAESMDPPHKKPASGKPAPSKKRGNP